MIIATLSVAAILVAIALGTLGRVNVGLVAIAFAFVIGHFLVGLSGREIVAGWPVGLFFMLLGMTLLFGIARANGTLALLARRMVAATVGDRRLIPPAFFLMALVTAAREKADFGRQRRQNLSRPKKGAMRLSDGSPDAGGCTPRQTDKQTDMHDPPVKAGATPSCQQ